jgi:uncharacterized coiled-coil protein SlyX
LERALAEQVRINAAQNQLLAVRVASLEKALAEQVRINAAQDHLLATHKLALEELHGMHTSLTGSFQKFRADTSKWRAGELKRRTVRPAP